MVDPEETPLNNGDGANLADTKNSLAENVTELRPVLSGLRRRGRRRVMRKKTVKDEEGYLGRSKTFWPTLTFLVKP